MTNEMSLNEIQLDEIEYGITFKRIFKMFDCVGSTQYVKEPVSLLQHSLQAGNLASIQCNDDKEFIIAALLHDIGHITGFEAGQSISMDSCGMLNHEYKGGEVMKLLGFSSRIEKLVRCHVNGKRYLCYSNPNYHDTLSEGSKTTLRHQGGPMTKDEAELFENDPDFQNILLLRKIDENSKDPTSNPPSLVTYRDLINSHSMLSNTNPSYHSKYLLTPNQIEFYDNNGYLIIKDIITYANYKMNEVISWIEEVSRWPVVEDKWLLHYEIPKQSNSNENHKQICRAENFLNYHEKLNALCRGILQDITSQLFHEDAVLFKEKINYKLPGGAGFRVHQDTPAYIGLCSEHISCLVSIDACTIENGCLEVAPGIWTANSIKSNPIGLVDMEGTATSPKMEFKPILCNPGDAMFFSGYLPHRSNPNSSSSDRRVLIVTYNPLAQGDHHEAYYLAKHKGSHGFNSGQSISFQGDFQGNVVSF